MPRPVPSEVGCPRYVNTGLVREQGLYAPTGESHLNVRLMESNSPVFRGDSSDYLSIRKEALLFAEYVGFGEVFTCLRKVPVGDTSLTEVDLNILTQARSLTEAWLSFEPWHDPQTIASAQSLLLRFQMYAMKTRQIPC